MSIKIQRTHLQKLVGIVVRCSAKANFIRDRVHIYAKNGALYLEATDLETAVRATIVTDIKPFDLVVNAKALNAACKVKVSELEIEPVENGIRIGQIIVTSVSSLDDYPDLTGAFVKETFERTTSFGPGLLDALKRCTPAISKESVRYALTGMRFEHNAGRPCIVASDTRRLHSEVLEGEASSFDGVIIPSTAVNLLTSSLRIGDVETRLHCEKDCGVGYRFDVGPNILIAGRKIEGRFPDWWQVVPKYSNAAVFEAGAMQNFIDAAAIPAFAEIPAKDRFEVFGISAKDGILKGTVRREGKTRYEAEIGTADSDLDKMWFNARYFHDVLLGLRGEVRMEFGDEKSAVRFVSKSAPDFQAVLMPLNEIVVKKL